MDAALDAAVLTFWKKGYEGTTLPDLTRAMGINRPSLYAAFGNKESLFHKVVERYLASIGTSVTSALAEPKVRNAIQRLLTASMLKPLQSRPRGCLLVNAALACGDETEPIRRELAERRRATESAVRARLAQAVAERELLPTTNVNALAKFIATFSNGLAVQQTSCPDGGDLLPAVDVAMKVIDGELRAAKGK